MQVISSPQQRGDFILPSHSGQLEIWTSDPSSTVRYPLTKGTSHLPQVAFTDIPHFEHS